MTMRHGKHAKGARDSAVLGTEEVSAAHSVGFHVCAEGGDGEKGTGECRWWRGQRRGKEREEGEEGRRKDLTTP